jgi:Cellulose biosynthesis protein BcsS
VREFAVQGGKLAGIRSALRAGGVLVLAALGLTTQADQLRAESDMVHTELFTGFEASNNYASGYAGGGYAFGNGLYAPGLRLRAVGAYGRYHYDGSVFDGSNFAATTFDGEVGFAAALVGYQFRPGAATIKVFAGVEAEDQSITPRDPDNKVQGSEVGLRLAVETWYDLAARWYASADASYGTAFQEYWSLARVGFRVRPKLSLGLEGGALGNEEYDVGRGGGFVRVNVQALEITLSGGFTGDYLMENPSGYVSLSVYRAF